MRDLLTLRAVTNPAITSQDAGVLFDGVLGEGRVTADEIDKAAYDPDRGLFVVRSRAGNVIGAAIATARATLPDGVTGAVSGAAGHVGVTGSIDVVAIDPLWRGQGLAGRLLREAVAWLTRVGCDTVYTLVWAGPACTKRLRPFKRIGFVPVASLPVPWAYPSVPCPTDGPSDCDCDATVLVRTLGR